MRTEETIRFTDGTRSTGDIVREIAQDTSVLVRQEMELARAELIDAVSARLRIAGGFGVAAILGFLALLFAAAGGMAALALVVPVWAAALIVCAAFGLMAAGALAVAKPRGNEPPMVPRETVRTVKEDIAWAKSQLKR